jgi:hypothetical protein
METEIDLSKNKIALEVKLNGEVVLISYSDKQISNEQASESLLKLSERLVNNG